MHSSIRAKGEAARERKAKKNAALEAANNTKPKKGSGIPLKQRRVSYASSQSNQAMKAIIQFQQIDTDGDGLMDKDEFKAAVFSMLDQGGLSHLKEELQGFIMREFEISDADNSQALSQREFGAWYIRFHDWVEERGLLKWHGVDPKSDTVELTKGNCKELMAVVKHCDHLQSVVLKDGEIDNSSLQSLAQLKHSGLKMIDLTDTKGFDDRGIKGLAVYCTSDLHTLKLGGTNVTDEGFLPIAKFCKGLRDVEVTRTKVTEESLKELHEDCTISYVEPPPEAAPVLQHQASSHMLSNEAEDDWSQRESKNKGCTCVIL